MTVLWTLCRSRRRGGTQFTLIFLFHNQLHCSSALSARSLVSFSYTIFEHVSPDSAYYYRAPSTLSLHFPRITTTAITVSSYQPVKVENFDEDLREKIDPGGDRFKDNQEILPTGAVGVSAGVCVSF